MGNHYDLMFQASFHVSRTQAKPYRLILHTRSIPRLTLIDPSLRQGPIANSNNLSPMEQGFKVETSKLSSMCMLPESCPKSTFVI